MGRGGYGVKKNSKLSSVASLNDDDQSEQQAVCNEFVCTALCFT